MNQFKSWMRLALLATPLVAAPFAHAQAAPTATQQYQLSVFAGGSGVFTNFYGGHNLSATAGADLSFLSYHGYHPALEIRGTYPVYLGQIDAQKSFMGGLRVDRRFNRLRPYADLLVGRGQIDYQRGGFTVGPLTYVSTTSNVFSFGGGVDYDIRRQWSLKADYQFQRWTTPIPTATTINPSNVTLGATYRFDFNHHYHLHKSKPERTATPAPAPAPLPPPQQPPQ
jgi:opacity protein-like surface antigen